MTKSFKAPLLAAALLALPALAFAAGSDDSTPPKTTATSTCSKGQVFDTKTKKCVDPGQSSLSSDELYEAMRELAYAERYEDAWKVLAAMEEGNTDRVLTYKGFITRKQGDMEGGMVFYAAAVAKNPDNILVRSYMGQAYVQQGEMVLAKAQLSEIRTRGGRGTWAEFSLRQAIDTGKGFTY